MLAGLSLAALGVGQELLGGILGSAPLITVLGRQMEDLNLVQHVIDKTNKEIDQNGYVSSITAKQLLVIANSHLKTMQPIDKVVEDGHSVGCARTKSCVFYQKNDRCLFGCSDYTPAT